MSVKLPRGPAIRALLWEDWRRSRGVFLGILLLGIGVSLTGMIVGLFAGGFEYSGRRSLHPGGVAGVLLWAVARLFVVGPEGPYAAHSRAALCVAVVAAQGGDGASGISPRRNRRVDGTAVGVDSIGVSFLHARADSRSRRHCNGGLSGRSMFGVDGWAVRRLGVPRIAGCDTDRSEYCRCWNQTEHA